MSEWAQKPPASNVIPYTRPGKKNANRKITPHVSVSPGGADVDAFVARLLANNGQTRAALQKYLDVNCGDIEGVVPVEHPDGSIAYFELRIKLKKTTMAGTTKTYRVLFKADITGSDSSSEDGPGQLCIGINPLAERQLYIPLNARALLAAVAAYRADSDALRPAFLWCEGEKARVGLAKRLESADVTALFEESGLTPVTSAWLGGATGVVSTNYALAPDDKNSAFRIAGRNDARLDLTAAKHFIILDNDTAGYQEGCQLADILQTTCNVAESDVHLVSAPAGAPSGWDDANLLPGNTTDLDRAKQILSSPLYAERWVYKETKDNKTVIDHEHMSNRRRALQLAGVKQAYVDTSTSSAVFVGTRDWLNSESPSDPELLGLAETALKVMGHQPTVPKLNLPAWRDSLHSLIMNNRVDPILNEHLARIANPPIPMSDDNRPERLFVKAFGMPDTRYHQLVGWHLIRDLVALAVRPALGADPVIPQLLYIWVGPEGLGKSAGARVLAGGSPGSVSDTPRYTDKVDLADLKGSETHEDRQLHRKISGRTVIEFADRSLGADVNRTTADAIKRFANKGQLEFRLMHSRESGRCNLRCVKIFTTNNSDVLTPYMGVRRYLITDLNESTWPTPAQVRLKYEGTGKRPSPDDHQRMLGRNPGLNWLQQNLAAMTAHMHASDAWKDDLLPTAELAALMPGSQDEYLSEENWETIFADELVRFRESGDIGIIPAQIARYVEDSFKARVTSHQISGFMKGHGWSMIVKRVGADVYRTWSNSTSSKSVSRFAVWQQRDGGTPGRWKLQSDPTDENKKLMDENVPF